MDDLPSSPAASHSLGPSVTPGMGAKVTATRVAMLISVSESESVVLCCGAGAGAGVGEVRGDGSPGITVVV